MRILVESLVSCRLVERTQVLEVRTNLDIVEIVLVHLRGHTHSSAIPTYLEFRIFFVDILRQSVDTPRLSITAHKGDAGDILPVLGDELVNGVGGERHAHIFPQVLRVAARTATRTARDVDGERNLIRNLLEHNACVDVL